MKSVHFKNVFKRKDAGTQRKAMLSMSHSHLCLLLFGVIAVLNSSCEKDHMLDCFKGTGSVETESRSAPAFNRVYVYDNVDAEIYPGHDFKIEVTAGSKLIESITTEVKDNVLYIHNENKCNWVRSFKNEFKAKVWLPDMVELNAYGSGDVTLKDTIRANEFVYNNWAATGDILMLFNTGSARPNIHTGSANITLRGHIGVLYLYNNGVGVVDARDCESDIIFTESLAPNNQYVNANHELDVKISYTGDIYYNGNPSTIKKQGVGTGRLIKMD